MKKALSKGGASILALVIPLIVYGVMIVSQQPFFQNLVKSNVKNATPITGYNTQPQTQPKVQTPPATTSQTQFSDLIINGSDNIKINPGSKIGYNIIMVSMNSGMIIANWKGEGISVNVVNPNGGIVDLTKSQITKALPDTNPLFFNQGGAYMLSYNFPEPISDGTWKITVANSGSKAINFGISVAGSSNIVVAPAMTHVDFHSTEHIVIAVGVGEMISKDEIKPLNNMSVSADIISDNRNVVKTVQLYDFKNVGIGIPGIDPLHSDGIYESRDLGTMSPGMYTITYTVKGKNLEGKLIALNSSPSGGNGFIVSNDSASIVGNPEEQGLDTTGDGKTSYIQFNFWVHPKGADHSYILVGTLVSPDGKECRKSGNFNTSVMLKPSLLFELSACGANKTNGVFKLKDVALFEQGDTTSWVDAYLGSNGDGVYTTKYYTVK